LHLHLSAAGVACRLALLSDWHALLVLRSLLHAGDRILKRASWAIRWHRVSVPAFGRLRPIVPNLVLLIPEVVEAAIRIADCMSVRDINLRRLILTVVFIDVLVHQVVFVNIFLVLVDLN
jgi:hypothetical protein